MVTKKCLIKAIFIFIILHQIKGLDDSMVMVKNLTGKSPIGVFKLGILQEMKTLNVKNILKGNSIAVYLVNVQYIIRSDLINPGENT